MPLASHGALRATGRKAANTLRTNHHSTNGQGSGGPGGARALHLSSSLSTATHVQAIWLGKTAIRHTIEHIRPRTPANSLFSSTRNFVTNLFTNISSPGLRVPVNLPQYNTVGSRSLHSGLKPTIQSGLSLPIRHALHSKAFGAGTFLPRAPISPRPPIATQMGLGTARNFSSGRPIFQNIVDNAPIALRSLYEADLDLDFARRKAGLKRPLFTAVNTPKVTKSGERMKPKAAKINKRRSAKKSSEESEQDENSKVFANPTAELEHYFRVPTPPAVTTYIFIPLAPTPTNRLPLSARDALPYGESTSHPGRFIPLREVGGIHASHSRHALRVSTLFARLDQANVWAHTGVTCSPYSGYPRKVTFNSAMSSESEDDDELLEGVCTFLKLEFPGWTLAEVRGVIGESGRSWCVFEEVWRDEENGKGMLSEAEDEEEGSLFSPPSTLSSEPDLDVGMRSPAMIDPAQSFVMPTLDFSSSFLGQSAIAGASVSTENPETAQQPKLFDYEDPWMDGVEYEADSSLAGSPAVLSRSLSSSSFSSLDMVPPPNGLNSSSLDMIIDPPSENGWFAVRSRSGRIVPSSRSESEGPREVLF